MLLKDYRTFFLEKLSGIYDVAESESFFYIVLRELKGWKRVDLAMNFDAVLSDIEIEKWNIILKDLQQQKPIQYILGSTNFYSLDFEVNANTLIPRPETEELVKWIINDVDNAATKILDIGTGSGCIAITLAKNIEKATIYAIDVSKEALQVASNNAKKNGVNVTFWQKNILDTESLNEKFDIIVSNPPYVRNLEKKEIQKNVLDYEPHLALFVEDKDPLLFYRKIAILAKTALVDNGKLYFEINQYLGQQTLDLLRELGFKNPVLKKDIYGNDRMVKCYI